MEKHKNAKGREIAVSPSSLGTFDDCTLAQVAEAARVVQEQNVKVCRVEVHLRLFKACQRDARTQ